MNEAERYLCEHTQPDWSQPHAETPNRSVPEPPSVEPTGRQVAVSCGEAWTRFWKRGFDGRSSRSEYWWMFATLYLPSGLLYGYAESAGWLIVWLLCLLCFLVLFVRGLALAVRRLHDFNFSGWWFLVIFLPFIGPLLFLVMMLVPSAPKPNRFGPVPNVR